MKSVDHVWKRHNQTCKSYSQIRVSNRKNLLKESLTPSGRVLKILTSTGDSGGLGWICPKKKVWKAPSSEEKLGDITMNEKIFFTFWLCKTLLTSRWIRKYSTVWIVRNSKYFTSIHLITIMNAKIWIKIQWRGGGSKMYNSGTFWIATPIIAPWIHHCLLQFISSFISQKQFQLLAHYHSCQHLPNFRGATNIFTGHSNAPGQMLVVRYSNSGEAIHYFESCRVH